MNRVKTFDSSGIAPNGRLYAGDLNAIQDAAAALSDFTQTLGIGTLDIGETGLQLSRFSAGIARLTGALFIDKTLGLAALTTAARNALATGLAPAGTLIWNTDVGAIQVNKGSDGARNWKSAAGIQSRQKILTGTTSYTLPSGVSAINIRLIGGGGGGNSGAGGGAGGYVEKVVAAPLSSYVVAVGAGGVGGTGGTPTAGGNTTMASCTAGGGGPGLDTNPAGGQGGTASGGDINFQGNAGGTGSGSSVGGAGHFGGAGRAGTGSGNGGLAAAANTGAGGGGGSSAAGAAGGSGIIVVDEF